MSLGVPEGKLIMTDYDPAWKEYGREMIEVLKSVMKKAVDIQHIGSSAVEGMLSKPLIDIGVAVRSLDDVAEYVEELESRSIHYAGEYVEGQREFYMIDPESGYKSCHIHCVLYDSDQWNDYINIRDYLRANDEVRESYILLKRALLLMYKDRPDRYGPSKHYYMEDMRADAQEWREKQQ